ncbi:MAG: response regulator [bacterium]|nr:response regulator [bacterium]
MEEEQKKTILIVDDEAAVRKPLADELQFQGFSVLEAVNGKEGLRLALEKKPDLILLDIAMPEMTGLEVIRELRKDAWGKRARIIFITQLPADDAILKEIVSSEPSYYLMKSDWTIDDIMRKIKETLG